MELFGLRDAWVVEDGALEIVEDFGDGFADGEGEVDCCVDDGMEEHGGVVAGADDGLRGLEAGEDGFEDVFAGLLENGDHCAVGGEEGRDLLP